MWRDIFKQYLRYARLDHSYPESLFKINKEVVLTLRGLDYANQWKTAKENGWYHLYLTDHSFFVFNITDSKPSYNFYDRPIDAKTIKEFLEEDIGNTATAKNIRLCQEEYDDYLTTVNYRKHYTPIRYDFDTDSYKSGIHPAAHIHIGLDNNIRIGLEREFTPLAFLLFVIRHMYPTNWENLLNSSMRNNISKKLHTDLLKVETKYFGEHEKCDLYFNIPSSHRF
ncbi:DUF2290 domain-containing protein [Methylovulum psychrotolerans]|uniref:DUF2290 domain-containing protein n=1 Tax=Methylovulum psychrotolerans TaxID=1704499 RepID=UPI001BFF49BE|nr:DUF2290 domain-containing protein [Methylovulum psychrotolerans]MBT9100546.1 DUF2290 domain-containing protein [Methylovulum psychrotolerans]